MYVRYPARGMGGVLADVGGLPTVYTPPIEVAACAPDICLTWAAPWVGRRTETAAGASEPCRCKPVFELPSPVGLAITGILGALLAVKVVKGVTR